MRKLELTDLESCLRECESLMTYGYEVTGNWTLGQICRHLTMDIRVSMEGHPTWMYLFAPLRPLMRWLMLPKILRFDSPKGIRTASRFVPPSDVNDEEELQSYRREVERFRSFDSPFVAHPGFGVRDRQGLERIYSAHASHHLRFLNPANQQPSSAN